MVAATNLIANLTNLCEALSAQSTSPCDVGIYSMHAIFIPRISATQIYLFGG